MLTSNIHNYSANYCNSKNINSSLEHISASNSIVFSVDQNRFRPFPALLALLWWRRRRRSSSWQHSGFCRRLPSVDAFCASRLHFVWPKSANNTTVMRSCTGWSAAKLVIFTKIGKINNHILRRFFIYQRFINKILNIVWNSYFQIMWCLM